jgi:hypothetical protein
MQVKYYDIEIENRLFENMSQFKYLGTTVTNQNLIQEEIKKRLSSGNAWYHSIQNLLSSRSFSYRKKIRIYMTTIFPVVLHGCQTCSLKVFGNRALRRKFGPKRDEVT